jgi:hypothetical protein
MNAQKERGSDSENFSIKITEFGVVAEKLWRFEVPRAFLHIFREKWGKEERGRSGGRRGC